MINTPIYHGLAQSDLDAAGFKIIGLHTPSASTDAANKAYVDAHSGGGGGDSRKFDVKTYGAIGDGTTDDTTAIQDALADIPSDGGVLYFPAGRYKYAGATLTLNRTITVEGDGGIQLLPYAAVSQIEFASPSESLFTVTAHGCRFRDIKLLNTSSTTPTAGAGITGINAYYGNFTNITVDGFYICIDSNGGVHRYDNCWIFGAAFYGLRLRNTTSPDGGDHSISNCYFYGGSSASSSRPCVSAIRYESGGGAKFVNCKINAHTGSLWANGIDMAVVDGIGTTSDLLVSNCSIESCTDYGIKGTIGTSTWYNILITGNQFNSQGINLSAASSGGFNGVSLVGNVILTFAGSGNAISLTNCSNVMFGDNVQIGFTNLLITSGCTFAPTYIGNDLRLVPITGGGKLQARNPGTNIWVDADSWTNP